MNNLHIIANFLFLNPGARYSDITRHLCKVKNKPWHRGMYSRYFSNYHWMDPRAIKYKNLLWKKCNGGWILTLRGHEYVTLAK